jgi:hypothetical protein
MCDIEMKDAMAFLLAALPFGAIGIGLTVMIIMEIVRFVVFEIKEIKRLTNK